MAETQFRTAQGTLAKVSGAGYVAHGGAQETRPLFGQLGKGLKPGYLDASTPLVLPPAVVVVSHVPSMYNGDPAFASMLKALFETHAKSVTGIDASYTLESGQQPVGHDGQQFDAPTVSKRGNVSPNFTWGEVTGNLVYRCMEAWLWDIADPDTQISMSTIPDGEGLPVWSMSAYSMSFFALQFDHTYTARSLLGAVYICNSYPTGTGDFGIERQIGQAKTMDRSITFTGIAIENAAIYSLASGIADSLKLHNGNYHNPGEAQETYSPKPIMDAGIAIDAANGPIPDARTDAMAVDNVIATAR